MQGQSKHDRERQRPDGARSRAPRGRGLPWPGLAALVLIATAVSPVGAQTLDVRQFDPAPSPHAMVNGHTTRSLGHLVLFGALTLHYANEELVGRRGDETVTRPVAHRTVAEVGLALGLWSRVEVGLALPVILAQSSRSWPDPGQGDTASGLGDLRLGVKGVILPNAQFRGFGLAAILELSAPTGRRGHLMGDPSVTFTPRLVLDWRHGSGLVVALNAGYRVRKEAVIGDLPVDDELRLSLGAEVPLRVYRLSLVAEVAAALGLGKLPSGPRIALRKSPVEALMAVRWRHPRGVLVTAGAGVGLTDGYGAPDVRAFLAVGYAVDLTGRAPRPTPTPTPRRAAPPPGERAPAAPPPGRPPPPPPLGDQGIDRAAAADPDADGDGIPTPLDRCPLEPEDKDGFEDDDGCPDPDNDKDGIPDVHDKCPNEPETVNGVADDDGCPDQGRSKVTITGRKIEILERVYFETGSDRLKPVSHGILKQVAAVLKANWWITKIRVEGHTDSRGDKEQNVDLSVRRAYRVRAFLVAQGVAATRLAADGFGPKRPIATNRTNAGRAKNRRVEFVILETARRGGAK